MEKRDFVFRENQLFLRKGWRNRGLRYRPPSVPPKSIPFSNKRTLYELIQEQNSKELPEIDPGGKILENLARKIPVGSIKPRSENLPRRRLKIRNNLELDMENLTRSEARDLKSAELSQENKKDIQNKTELSYREKIQDLERQLLEEKSLDKSIRDRKILRIDDTDTLIKEARNREVERIEGILADLTLKTEEHRRFHNEIREKFDRSGIARLEIDRNFAIFEDCAKFRNIEFLQEFSSIYRTSANCPHRYRDGEGKSRPSGSSSQRDRSHKKAKETVNLSLFTVRIQRIDSRKSRVTLTLDSNQEVSFVTSDGCENYVKLDHNRPELRYLGNDNHDKALLINLEEKLLDDLKLQKLKNQTLLTTLTDRPSTPNFPQNPLKDRSISIYLNLSTDLDFLAKVPCEICKGVNSGFKDIFREIFRVDRAIEPEFRDLDSAFREFAKGGEFIADLMAKVAGKFRNVAKTCFKILPNHAFFFEKCFKILAFALESAERKTVSQILGR